MIGVLPQNNGPKKNPVELLHTCCRLQEAAGQQCQPRGRLQMGEASPMPAAVAIASSCPSTELSM